jgi:hypothetical protein
VRARANKEATHPGAAGMESHYVSIVKASTVLFKGRREIFYISRDPYSRLLNDQSMKQRDLLSSPITAVSSDGSYFPFINSCSSTKNAVSRNSRYPDSESRRSGYTALYHNQHMLFFRMVNSPCLRSLMLHATYIQV